MIVKLAICASLGNCMWGRDPFQGSVISGQYSRLMRIPEMSRNILNSSGSRWCTERTMCWSASLDIWVMWSSPLAPLTYQIVILVPMSVRTRENAIEKSANISFSDYIFFLLGVLTSTAGIQTAVNELRARNIAYSDSWFTNKTHTNFFDGVFGICIFIFYSFRAKKKCEAAA